MSTEVLKLKMSDDDIKIFVGSVICGGDLVSRYLGPFAGSQIKGKFPESYFIEELLKRLRTDELVAIPPFMCHLNENWVRQRILQYIFDFNFKVLSKRLLYLFREQEDCRKEISQLLKGEDESVDREIIIAIYEKMERINLSIENFKNLFSKLKEVAQENNILFYASNHKQYDSYRVLQIEIGPIFLLNAVYSQYIPKDKGIYTIFQSEDLFEGHWNINNTLGTEDEEFIVKYEVNEKCWYKATNIYSNWERYEFLG